jgi:hypothetical protein
MYRHNAAALYHYHGVASTVVPLGYSSQLQARVESCDESPVSDEHSRDIDVLFFGSCGAYAWAYVMARVVSENGWEVGGGRASE